MNNISKKQLTFYFQVNLYIPLLCDVLPLLFADFREEFVSMKPTMIFLGAELFVVFHSRDGVDRHLLVLDELLEFHFCPERLSSPLLLVLELCLRYLERLRGLLLSSLSLPPSLVSRLGELLCSEALGAARPSVRDRLLDALRAAAATTTLQDFAQSRVIIASIERLDELSSLDVDGRLQVLSDCLVSTVISLCPSSHSSVGRRRESGSERMSCPTSSSASSTASSRRVDVQVLRFRV